MVFTVFTKAFDTVSYKHVLEALERKKVEEQVWGELLQRLLYESEDQIENNK